MSDKLNLSNLNCTLNCTLDAVEFASTFNEFDILNSTSDVDDGEILRATQAIEDTFDYVVNADDGANDALIAATQEAEANNEEVLRQPDGDDGSGENGNQDGDPDEVENGRFKFIEDCSYDSEIHRK